MLLMGDEVRRTQGGNNNSYCQNNEFFWFDESWSKGTRMFFALSRRSSRFG